MKNKVTIEIDGNRRTIPRAAYVTAKTKQLKEFGYTDLLEETVEKQLTALLAGKSVNVIGMFMEGEVIRE